MKHDRLFKELLTSFFYQFLELFFGDLAELIDRSHAPIFLDKESFGELPGDSRREKDLVVRVRLHSGEACFIVHIEHEAQNNSHFPQRMHLYFARLLERYGPPIYPIAVFSSRTRKPREGRYLLTFNGCEILDFNYLTLELAQLDWNVYVNRDNPVASALMARMKIARQDRPRVKVQCLRLLATLRLDHQKSALISRFVDTYLRLNPDEMRIFDHEVETTLSEEERQGMMRITTSWKEEGRLEGRAEGREEGIAAGREEGIAMGRQQNLVQLRQTVKLLLAARFGEQANALIERLPQLDSPVLDRLIDQLSSNAELSDLGPM